MGKRHGRDKSRRTTTLTSTSVIRNLRLEELIREEINSLLDSEINDERLQGAWITAVELTPDCAFARVWYTMTDETLLEDSQLSASFQRASGFFRRRLCEELALKRTPELRFQRDLVAHGGAGEEGTPA